MESKTYETGFFKKLDAALYYIGEFLLAFVLFYPVVAVAKGVLSDPAGRQSELGQFLSFSPQLLALASFMAFMYTVVFSKIKFKYIFMLCAAAFLPVAGIMLGRGFWPLFFGPAAALLLLWLAAKKSVFIHNLFIGGFNFFVQSFRPYEESIETFESIFSTGPGEKENKDGRIFERGPGGRAQYEANKFIALAMAAVFIGLFAAASIGGIMLITAVLK